MSDTCSFDYAVIRLVPNVELEEFINVGVILSCPKFKFLECRIAVNEERLKCFSENIDPATVRSYLETIPAICAGDPQAGAIAKLTQRERFYWLTAQRSTIIQTSPVHTGLTSDPRATLNTLFLRVVRS